MEVQVKDALAGFGAVVDDDAVGFAEAFVTAVVNRIRRNHFKRVLPPIAKLSNRTIGYDFLYLRDWGT